MQTLDVISVNLWQIIISLANLVILFLLFKRFLFKPVKEMIAKREAAVEAELDAARNQHDVANEERRQWEAKMATADQEADRIIQNAVTKANKKSGVIISTASERADEIIKVAKFEASLEHKAAQEGIKREIVDLSSTLTGKLLEREIKPEDHSELIDEFINEIGEIS